MTREDQQYGEWLRVDLVRHIQKTMVVVSRRSHGASFWKKGPAMGKILSTTTDLLIRGANVSNFGMGRLKENLGTEVTSMDVEPSGVVFSSLNNLHGNYTSVKVVNSVVLNNGLEVLGSQLPYPMPMQNVKCNKVRAINNEGLHGTFSFNAKKSPLADITNQAATQPLKSSKKKWTKLLHEVEDSNTSFDIVIQESRRPGLETSDLPARKKKWINSVSDGYKENILVVAGL